MSEGKRGQGFLDKLSDDRFAIRTVDEWHVKFDAMGHAAPHPLEKLIPPSPRPPLYDCIKKRPVFTFNGAPIVEDENMPDRVMALGPINVDVLKRNQPPQTPSDATICARWEEEMRRQDEIGGPRIVSVAIGMANGCYLCGINEYRLARSRELKRLVATRRLDIDAMVRDAGPVRARERERITCDGTLPCDY